MKKSLVSPSFLKQKARQLKREKSLSQSQALDEAAQQFGFSNYKNYLNVLEANLKQSKPAKEVLLKQIASEKNIYKKMDLAISSIFNSKIPFPEQLDILQLFQDSDDSDDDYDSEKQAICEKLILSEDLRYKDYGVQPCLQFVCEKLNLMKDEIQSYFLNSANTDEGKDDLHDLDPEILDTDHFIAREASVYDLIYEIDEGTLRVEGDYYINFKFDSDNIPVDEEYPAEYHRSGYFNDRKMSGSFGATVDKDKKITIVHSDM